jgi:phosphoglycolate phosphatase
MSKPAGILLVQFTFRSATPLGPTLLLDLDGTLVDSVPDIAAALNRTLAARGIAPFTERETAAMVGDGSDRLLARAFAARGATPDPQALPDLVADYAANATVETRLFPGVADTLTRMHGEGWRLAVCTNKLQAPARAVLEGFGILSLMAAVGGADTVPARKPDPAHLLVTLASIGGEAGQAVMLGDHENDVLAARAAGVKAIFAGWGYGPPAMAAGAAAVAARIEDVPALAAGLLAG